MSPKPDVSEERTTQIIEAAMNVFARDGFNKARMDDIAKETGVSKGTLYLYFKSKDAIISAILQAILSRELAQAQKFLDLELPAAEKITRFVDVVVKDLVSMKPMMSIYLEFMALAIRRKAVKEVISESFSGFLTMLVPVIEEGIASGEFRQADAQEAALAFGAVIEGTILLWVYDPEQVDLSRHIHSSVDLVMQGLRAA